jgi:sugar/nucleoside kinase (ribokinase family)
MLLSMEPRYDCELHGVFDLLKIDPGTLSETRDVQWVLICLTSFGFHSTESGLNATVFTTLNWGRPRASSVTYDRGYTAISKVKPGEVDWKSIFRDVRWFHLSGITPVLAESAAAESREALQTAHAIGVTTSYDRNNRSKLWIA